MLWSRFCCWPNEFLHLCFSTFLIKFLNKLLYTIAIQLPRLVTHQQTTICGWSTTKTNTNNKQMVAISAYICSAVLIFVTVLFDIAQVVCCIFFTFFLGTLVFALQMWQLVRRLFHCQVFNLCHAHFAYVFHFLYIFTILRQTILHLLFLLPPFCCLAALPFPPLSCTFWYVSFVGIFTKFTVRLGKCWCHCLSRSLLC